ncbi:MAG: TolB family protein [Acidobacteriota bacterium]
MILQLPEEGLAPVETAKKLPGMIGLQAAFRGSFFWSPDGKQIAGSGKEFRGTILYDLETSDQEIFAPESEGAVGAWLPDGRLIVRRSEGFGLLDPNTGIFTAVASYPENLKPSDGQVSPDGRWIYFTQRSAEGDIWIGTFED